MAALTLRAHGSAPVTLAWERYADPDLWPTWAPQIQRVDTGMERLAVGGTGTVRAGLAVGPHLAIPFEVVSVDEPAMQWCWRAHLGPATLRLEHGVTAHHSGSATWLRVQGLLPVVLGYAPLARFALTRLVAA